MVSGDMVVDFVGLDAPLTALRPSQGYSPRTCDEGMFHYLIEGNDQLA